MSLRVASAALLLLSSACIKKTDSTEILAQYKQATEEQATEVGEAVAKGFSDGHPEVLDQYIDFDGLAAFVTQGVKLSDKSREGFVKGLKNGIEGGSFGKQLTLSLGKDAKCRFLRQHLVGAQRRAMLRVLSESGMVNYLDLIVSVDAKGAVRVLDMDVYASGQTLSETMRSLVGPALESENKSLIERLLAGGKDHDDGLVAVGKEVPKIRAAIAQGKHAEGMKMFLALPADFQKSRAGLLLRMSCAQGMGDAEYEKALDAINTAFPNDPSLALVQIDRYYLKKSWAQAARAIDHVNRGVGGDAYLYVMKANVLSEVPDFPGARQAAEEAIKLEPTLETAWWSAVTVELKAKNFPMVALRLTDLEHQLGIHLGDLTDNPMYAEFRASPAYGAWMARSREVAGIGQ